MNRHPRSGVAVIWALVVISVVTVLAAGVARQYVLARRTALEQAHKAQAHWLARGGIDLAAAKLLTDPEKYTGEVVKLLPRSELTITVVKGPAGQFVITSHARFPIDGPETENHFLRAVMKRTGEPGNARLERVPDTAP